MRLAFISNADSVHTRRWVDWFKARGHAVMVFADRGLRIPWPEVPVIDLPARCDLRRLRYPVWLRSIRATLRGWRPDILHAHRVARAGWLGAASGLHPLVVTPWGSDLMLQTRRSSLARWLARWVLRRADLVTADSQALLDRAIELGAARPKTRLVSWGVDLSRFRPGSAAALRARLGLEADRVILSIRAVQPLYNLDQIVAALQEVRAVLPRVMLVLRDYNADPDYRQRLARSIERRGLGEAIRWIGPADCWEQNVETYRLADVAVSVPSSDSQSISILEAMACGVPVIASDLPAARELIRPGENGLLVPCGDPEALAEALIELLREPEQRAGFVRRNLELVRGRADQDVEMARMERLYQELLERR
jgi:glycosyltransferase involved in cell wall biosynthesis